MRAVFLSVPIAAAVLLGACSRSDEGGSAPAGAMEAFAEKQAAAEAEGKAQRLDAARAREVARAADARQKLVAAEGMARFDRAEKALDAGEGDGGD